VTARTRSRPSRFNTFGSTNSLPLSLQIKTNPPITIPTVGIRPADGHGDQGRTVSRRTGFPTSTAPATPRAKIQLYQVVNGVRIPIGIQADHGRRQRQLHDPAPPAP